MSRSAARCSSCCGSDAMNGLSSLFGALKNLVARVTPGGHRETLRSLGSRVEVVFDEHGIPHLFAENDQDLFRAQGFVTARERLFQLDLARRTATGRLAEIFGDVPVSGRDLLPELDRLTLEDVDYFLRTLGLGEAARAGLGWLDPRAFRVVRAFTEGVNEFIHSRAGRSQPSTAYRFLDLTPQEWQPADTMAVARMYALDTSMEWRAQLWAARVRERLDRRREAQGSGTGEGNGEEDGDQPQGMSAVETLTHPLACAALLLGWNRPSLRENGRQGVERRSNAVVLSGEVTGTGRPLLCCDPHAHVRLPSAFQQIHLRSPQLDLIGLAIPGMPGIVAGHNHQIAWGMATVRADDSDLFIEKLDPTGNMYWDGDRYVPLAFRKETVVVRGSPSRRRTVRLTRRGPLISDALSTEPPVGTGYSLQWTAQEAVREVQGFLGLGEAEGWGAFREAASNLRVPSMTLVFADQTGHIGSLDAGSSPRRPRTTGPRRIGPLPGHTLEHDWQTETPREDRFSAYDPPEGRLIHAAMGGGSVGSRGPDAEPDLGRSRIEALLEGPDGRAPGVEKMLRILRDQYSLQALDLLQRVIGPHYEGHARLAPEVRQMTETLLAWNGRAGPESMATTIFAVFSANLLRLACAPTVGKRLYWRWTELAPNLGKLPEILGLEPESAGWDESSVKLLDRALTSTYEELNERLGPAGPDWRWGENHRLTLRHPFHWKGNLRAYFVADGVAGGGDHSTLNCGAYAPRWPFEQSVAPAARLVIDVGAWDRSRWVVCGGAGGDPDSPSYLSQVSTWRKGDALPMIATRSTLVQQSILTLEPRGRQ